MAYFEVHITGVGSNNGGSTGGSRASGENLARKNGELTPKVSVLFCTTVVQTISHRLCGLVVEGWVQKVYHFCEWSRKCPIHDDNAGC